jgi:hypothetical protein
MSEATPLNKIRKPRFTSVNVREAVDRLDPQRHEPQVEYQFSNGRKFKES